jgi:hypothetical protein
MINKIKNIVFTILIVTQMQLVHAADSTKERSFRSAEVDRESILVSEDGTGIINDFSCVGCGFKILKVDSATLGFLGSTVIGVADLIKQSEADVGLVKYAVNSNTVYEIRFSH